MNQAIKNIILSEIVHIVITIAISTFIFSNAAYVANAAELRVPVPGIFTRDLTIYRTVNTLSCHPQNPLLMEVPHYILWKPDKDYGDKNGVKGACWAYHNEGNTNFLEVKVGSKGLPGSEDANTIRPGSPMHHYTVFEFPNPRYDPLKEADCKNGRLSGTAAFCGKYVHWEGYSFMMELAVSAADHEVWYIKNFIGGMDIQGRNVSAQDPVGKVILDSNGLPALNGTEYTVYGGKLVDSITHIHWRSCQGWATNDGPVRIGDENRPCIDRKITKAEIPREAFANPLLFSDIPHNRFTRNPRNLVTQGDGESYMVMEWFNDDQTTAMKDAQGNLVNHDYLRDDNDDAWVKCKDKFPQMFNLSYRDYIVQFKKYLMKEGNVAVAPYTLDGCDYNPLNEDPGATDGYPAPKPSTQTQLIALTNRWVSAQSSTPIITSSPSITPTSTTRLIGDCHPAPNGDGDVDIFDYNLLVSNLGSTTNLACDFVNLGVVDIFDYNKLLENFRQ